MRQEPEAPKDTLAPRRAYAERRKDNGNVSLELRDRAVDLGPREYSMYTEVVDWAASPRPRTELERVLRLGGTDLDRLLESLRGAGLFARRADAPPSLSGEALHRLFAETLPSWLGQAFSHPFWERMMTGKGSKRLYTGWLVELYHYTKNANRHMPLSCAHTRAKAIKSLRAKHYAEEWNHYHYFMKALKALGLPDSDIAESVPLPMTLALSNFMRQAAREDVLAYSICSAVLEGTTTDRRAYNPYYEKTAELYGIPKEAVAPIYAHLDLDVKYQHSDLFLDILRTVESVTAERAARVLDYGHQLAEHIWLWTDAIESYYDSPENPLPRRPLDPTID